MPANFYPPSSPFFLCPAHMDEQIVDYSPDWANQIVKRAYDGEIEAICQIFNETLYWADQAKPDKDGEEYPLIMSVFLSELIKTLKVAKEPNSITELPKKGGRPTDRRTQCIRGYISELVQIEQKLSNIKLEDCYGKVYELLYPIAPRGKSFGTETPKNSYQKNTESQHQAFAHKIEKLTNEELIEYRRLILAVLIALYDGNTPASLSSHPAIWSRIDFEKKKFPQLQMSSI